jgi:hypothetical protein
MIPAEIVYGERLPLKASHHEEVDIGVLKQDFAGA